MIRQSPAHDEARRERGPDPIIGASREQGCRPLSREGLAIWRARISTEADRAIDSFYVVCEKGKKITSAARLKRIRATLENEIAELS